jgi:nucleoside phosphorylase
MVICAGNGEDFSFATSIGMGLVQSTMTLSKICATKRPKYFVFIGTAGSYGEHKIGDIITSYNSSNIELSFLQDKSYTPIEENVISVDGMKSDCIINSSNYISTDEKLTKKFLPLGIGAENMEFFACVNIAKALNIACKGVFYITNYTNKNAHKDYMQNKDIAKEKLTKFLYKNKK